MTKRPVTNLAASVRDRLLRQAHAGGLSFQLVLIRYYQERMLARLEVSHYHRNFMLKGGLLLYALALDNTRQVPRPTRDIDFRVQGLPHDPESMRIYEACATGSGFQGTWSTDALTWTRT